MSTTLTDIAVIFDLDGTLIDTAGDLTAAMNHVLALEGLPTLPVERVRHMVGFGARAMLKEGFKAAGELLDDGAADRHVATFLDYYTNHIDEHSAPFEGAIETIESLRRDGAKTAICTNKREAPAVQLMSALGLDHLFETIVGGDTAAAPKPDPAPVTLCLTRCDRAHGVFIGDSDTDLRAAENAGMPSVFVDFGYGPSTFARRANATISHYADLPATIATILDRR